MDYTTFGVSSDQQHEPWSTHDLGGHEASNYINFGESVGTPFLSSTSAAILYGPAAGQLSNSTTTPPLNDFQMYDDAGLDAATPNFYGQIPDEYSTFSADMDLLNEQYRLVWPDWLPELELDDDPDVAASSYDPELTHRHESTIITREAAGLMLDVFDNYNPEVTSNFVRPDVSRSTTSSMSDVRCCRWPKLLWLVRACHRFSHAAAASLRAKVPEANSSSVFKGVMEKKGKFVCEMRVMKKIQLEKKKIIKKVWLGTYKTQAQAARALDVGKYFFNAKETKTFLDPNIETMLSTLSQQLLAQPLEVLVAKVKTLAKHYGNHGTLP